MSLLNNNEYTLTIEYEGHQMSYDFLSKLSPLYSSVRQIRTNPVKKFVKDTDDEDILFQIYENSDMAERIAIDNDNDFTNESEIPYYVVKYVTAKTQYDMFLEVYLDLANTNAKSIDLADFSVSGGDLEGLEEILDMLEDELDKWKLKLKGQSKAKPVSAVKAEGTYPLRTRREFGGTNG
jgi:hypothetical protein